MKTCASILGIKWDMRSLITPIPLLTNNTRQGLKRISDNFERIAKRHSNPKPPTKVDLQKVYRLFMETAPYGQESINNAFQDLRELRRLAWSLDYSEEQSIAIINSKYLKEALVVLHQGWRTSMVLAIFDTLLKHWTSLNQKNKELLAKFLSEKLNEYQGRREQYLKLKQHQHYFTNSRGGVLLGSKLITEEGNLTGVMEYFGLNEHAKSYQYWGEVAAAFTQTALRHEQYQQYIDEIIDFLKIHRNRDTAKRCLSKIVLRLGDSATEERQKQLQTVAFRLIGDPLQDYNWLPWDGATEREKVELMEARKLINNWIARDFINLFFAHTYMDDDRKEFWLEYTKYVTNFRIFSRLPNQIKLRLNEEAQELAGKRIGELKDGTQDLSALVLEINDYLLVEFSSKGHALYAYKKTNPECPDITSSSLYISDLKKTWSLSHVKKDMLWGYSEGRLHHSSGDWQSTFAAWLSYHVGV